MNVLTFDTEEWYNEKINFNGGRESKFKQYDEAFFRLLDQLDELHLKGTFFCLGKLAEEFPYVVKEIAKRGHEVGCHSHEHKWLNKMTENEFRNDTRSAINALEDLIGQKVVSYRAPAFTIGEGNKWAIDILAECGIENDASIFPAKRAFGGFSNFGEATPCNIEHDGARLREFPVCIANAFGKQLVFSGGGYFRVFPYWYQKYQMNHRDYTIWYLHLLDLVSEQKVMMTKEQYEAYYKEKGTLLNRYMRYFKTTIGSGGAYEKLVQLLKDGEFINVQKAVEMIEWSNVKTVKI